MLTGKDVPFVWTEECQEAFQHLKTLLIEAPVLVFPDFSRMFVLEMDASGEGLRAVLAGRNYSTDCLCKPDPNRRGAQLLQRWKH